MSLLFLERQQELERLQARLHFARKRQGCLVAISGEAGIGKSRLIEEFALRNRRGIQCLAGRAFSATSATPYAVWVEALEPHLRSLPRRELLRVVSDSPDLLRLFPSVASLLSIVTEAPQPSDVGLEQTRLFGQVRLLLSRLSETTPVVVALDNLQWADRSSLELLHFVTRSLTAESVLIIGAFRIEDVSSDAPLASCIASLERLGLVESIAPGRLGVASTSALIADCTGTEWPEDVVRQLHARCQGNPFFVGEFVKHALVRQEGQTPPNWQRIDSLPISIGDLLSERFGKLSEDPRRVLAVAAVLETQISYALIRAITGFDEERLLAALENLTSLHLLNEEVQDGRVSYEFHQLLVQTTVYQRLGAARRQFLHRVTAAELMRSAGSDKNQAGRIARHLIAGAAEGRRKEALPFLLQAAHGAVSLFANPEAISLLTMALQILETSSTGTISRVELEMPLGESYKRLGNFTRAVEVWRSALDHAADDRERATLRRCIGRALWQAGREAECMAELKAGIEQLGSAKGTLEGAFLRQEMAQTRLRQGDVGGALSDAAEVLAQVDEDEAPELVSRVHIVICLAYGQRGDMRSAFQAGAKAVELSETLAYPGAAFLAHYTLAALLRYYGEQQQFDEHTAACSRISTRMQSVALESWPLSIIIERYTFLGRIDEAIAIGERAVAIDRLIEQGTILPRSLAFLAVAYRVSGNQEKARQCIEEAMRLVEVLRKTEIRTIAVVRGAHAYLDFLDAKFDRARGQAEQLLSDIARSEPLKFYVLHPYVLPVAAEAAVRSGAIEQAKRHLADIQAMQIGSFRPAEACALQVSGLIHFKRGDYEHALKDLAQSASLWEQMSRPFQAARARVDLAEVHDAQGDRVSAVSELMAAGRTFNAMGAVREAAIVIKRLRDWGSRPAFDVRRRASGERVSVREQQVIALIAKGRLNREIASELFLSELTVETHVKNILRKLGLRSRTQVATYAAQMQIGAAATPGQAAALDRAS